MKYTKGNKPTKSKKEEMWKPPKRKIQFCMGCGEDITGKGLYYAMTHCDLYERLWNLGTNNNK